MTVQKRLWWQQGIIYQVYPRSFADSNNDGIGDLWGIISRLDYLAWLGIDAIWISPIYPSPMIDFGYDIMNFSDIAPIFGDLAVFDALVEHSHALNIKIILDFVPNHSSDQHPWFLESRSSRTNTKRNWYIWADSKADGSPPNNWLSIFGGPAWEWDEMTGQYYLHSFLKQQPDLNWRAPDLKATMIDVLRFWLERGVDGFRIDVANFIMKDPQLRDNPLNGSGKWIYHKSMGEYDSQLHPYDKGHPDLHQVYAEMRQVLDSYSTSTPRMSVGEVHVNDKKEWMAYYGLQVDELHMPFNFSLLYTEWQGRAIQKVVDELESVLPKDAWPNYVLGNHDESRLLSRVGPAQARVGTMLLLTLRGTPTLYYGDELGMHDVQIPLELIQDCLEKNIPESGLGRDPSRTPMQWDDSPHAGFCSPKTTPWLPASEDYQLFNVAQEQKSPSSMLSFTRELIQLRRREPALHSGSYQSVSNLSESCFAFLRADQQTRYLIVLNFSHQEQFVSLPLQAQARVVISTHQDQQGYKNLNNLLLRPDEGYVLQVEAPLP